MNTQPNLEAREPPSCALCEEPGVSFVVEVREQGDGMWLCARHLARLQGQSATVPELSALFEGALVITEITAAPVIVSDDEQGRAR